MSTWGGEGVKNDQNLVHVVIEWPHILMNNFVKSCKKWNIFIWMKLELVKISGNLISLGRLIWFLASNFTFNASCFPILTALCNKSVFQSSKMYFYDIHLKKESIEFQLIHCKILQLLSCQDRPTSESKPHFSIYNGFVG